MVLGLKFLKVTVWMNCVLTSPLPSSSTKGLTCPSSLTLRSRGSSPSCALAWVKFQVVQVATNDSPSSIKM